MFFALTRKKMPWYKTDNIHMQWTEWDNNPHYMGITPHQTTSKVVTQRRTIRRASIVRRGIAAEFENDFVKTPLGRTSFMASLAQMARSVQETANVEVLRALLHCHRFQQMYVRQHDIVGKEDLDAWLNRKAERFMISQKEEFGLEKMSTMIDQEQEQYGGRANVWILGREVHDYCSLVPPEKIFNYLGGQEAVDRVNGRHQNHSAAGGTMGNVRSLQPERMIGTTPVFLAKSNFVESTGKAELLSRTVEVGIYNLMVDRTRDFSRYRTEGRNLRVYDNDTDAWADIEFAQAIEECIVWDAQGNLIDVHKHNSGRSGGLNQLADEDYDFLSFVGANGKRQKVEYFGDISPNFVTVAHFENAAQTLLNALSYNEPKEAKRLTAAFEQARAGVVPEDEAGRKAWKKALDDTFQEFGVRLENLMGADSFFFKGRGDKPHGEWILDNFVRADMRIAQLNSSIAVGGSADGADRRAAIEDKWLRNTIGAAILKDQAADHGQALEQIVAQAEKPCMTRAQEIKQLMLKIHKKDQNAFSSFPNNRVQTFQEEQQARAESGASASIDRSQVRYVPAGQKAPEGYSFVSSPADKTREPLFRMPAFIARSSIGMPRAAGVVDPGARGTDDGSERRERDRVSLSTPQLTENMARYGHLAAHVRAIQGGSSPTIIKALAVAYAMIAITRQRLVSLARNHLAVLFGFLLIRAHCTYKTRFGIKCAAGGATGYTFFGHSNMQIEHEAARKVGMMHYTAYLSAVVLNPKNVYVIEDLFCQKYLGGMGVEFWKADKYRAATAATRRSKSIICIPLPPTIKKLEQKIDMRGRWYTEQVLGLVSQERFDRPLFPGAGRSNHLLGLADATRKDRHANRGRTAMNTVCWQGVEWYFNTLSGQWDDFTVEAGNFGHKVYPGCGLVRNGQYKYLKEPSYLNVH
jgi:hypothetical protein